MNSCDKGKRGERGFRDWLRAHGFWARRGRQFSGSPESPDVVTNIDGHFEVKYIQKGHGLTYEWLEQARRDASEGKIVFVAHRANNSPWLITMYADDAATLIRESGLVSNPQIEKERNH